MLGIDRSDEPYLPGRDEIVHSMLDKLIELVDEYNDLRHIDIERALEAARRYSRTGEKILFVIDPD